MLSENRVSTHPGEVLLEEFLIPLEMSQVAFAEHIGVPVQRVNKIVRGKRGNRLADYPVVWDFPGVLAKPTNQLRSGAGASKT